MRSHTRRSITKEQWHRLQKAAKAIADAPLTPGLANLKNLATNQTVGELQDQLKETK